MEANASGMICAKCGTLNAAGDAFCGSCGAFLEFAAEQAGTPEVAPVAPEPMAPAAFAAGTNPPEAAPTPPALAPLPAAAPSAAPSVATTGATCPVCGRANPTGRTFCISCGERLTPAGRPVATPGRAAAPAQVVAPRPAASPLTTPTPAPRPAPSGPQWEFPTTPARPVATPIARPGAPVPPPRRGRSPLPLIVGVGVLFLVLVGGGAAILLSGGSSQATPTPASPDASAAASGASATESGALPSASATGPSAGATTPGPSAEPATLPPGPSIGLTLTGATASSSLAKRPASAAIDGDPTTAWETGTPSPADQWLQVMFAPAAVTRIQLWNGWQRTQDFYGGSHRPHHVTIRFDNETPIPLELKDVYGSQSVDIPAGLGIVGVTQLRITILDWYPAKKTAAAGSPTRQAAISEIRVYGIPVTP